MRDEDICWYHGKITREEADEILKEEGREDGSFLVRKSNSSVGDYVLSILHNNEVNHYQIIRHTEDFFSIEDNIKTHGLDSLIEYYQSSAVSVMSGLKLTTPCNAEVPPPDLRCSGKTNLLHRATKEGDYKVVYALLKAGYKLEAKNHDGQTAVLIASMYGKDDILRELIDYGANANSRDTAGNTPLHYACQNNFRTTARLLIQVGKANLQARNTETDWVPLHDAAYRGNKDVVKELLSLNAPLNPRTKEGKVPLDLAIEKGHHDCAEILRKYKCPIPRTSKSKWYHGTLDRQEAEKMIRDFSDGNGTFLVRYSNRNKGYVLSVLNENIVFNYIIRSKDNFLYIDDGPYLNSLEHVIDYYSFIPDGLPTTLEAAVPPKPKPPVPESSTIPRKKKVQAIQNKRYEESRSQEVCQLANITFQSNLKPVAVPGVNNNVIKTEKVQGYIPLEQLAMEKQIGQGEFGSVYEGIYKSQNGDVKVAIKTLLNEQIEANRDAFLNEAELMMKLDHHCVVKLVGLSLGPPLCMVQELIALGSMLAYITTNQQKINPNYEFKLWAAQIACGMKYLEEQRFIHRDLAARNILLATVNQVKISDFGLSKALGADHEYYRAMHGGKWPLKWYAPESYNYGTFSHKSDVWSYGVTIWEIYSFGLQPYGDMKGSEAIAIIEKGDRLEKPDKCPDYVYKIMLKCWEYDAENRPTFLDLMNTFSDSSDYANIRELLSESNLG